MGRRRCLKSSIIPTIINDKYRTIIKNSTVRQMERLFNALPYELQNLTNVETDMLKKHLDNWPRIIPDSPKIDDYGVSVPAASNSIVDQSGLPLFEESSKNDSSKKNSSEEMGFSRNFSRNSSRNFCGHF